MKWLIYGELDVLRVQLPGKDWFKLHAITCLQASEGLVVSIETLAREHYHVSCPSVSSRTPHSPTFSSILPLMQSYAYDSTIVD
jgi:hypothetical protein